MEELIQIRTDKDYSGIDPVIIDKLTNEEIMEQVGIYVNNFILDILIIEKINGEALMFQNEFCFKGY